MGIQFADVESHGYPELPANPFINRESTDLVNLFHFWSHLPSTRSFFSPDSRTPFSSIIMCFLGVGCLGILGCPPDNSPHQAENQRLKKHIAKQESVIASLQEGNKVMQQQIDLLNQESREVKKELEQKLQTTQDELQKLSQGHQDEDKQLQILETENQKLTGDVRWLRAQREKMRKALVIQQVGGKSQELPFPFPKVLDVTEKALTHHGYSVMTSMQTDQKAVYVTERKTSPPTSLEVSGFRNQYLLTIDKGKSEKSTIWVKAEFEKLTQNGNVFGVSDKELNEIELRLIQDIRRTLENGQPPQELPQKG